MPSRIRLKVCRVKPDHFPRSGVRVESERPGLGVGFGVLPAKARVTDEARTRDLRDHNPK